MRPLRPLIHLALGLVAALLSASFSRAADAPGLVTGKPALLFLCAGQSNMAGSGTTAEYNSVHYSAKLPRTDIWARVSDVSTDTGGWTALGTGGSHGPEILFGINMAAAYPDRTIAIVKVSRGGTTIGYWTPDAVTPGTGDAGYLKLKSLLPAVLDDLEAKRLAGTIPSYEVGGFVWMQGEGNANGIVTATDAYLVALRRLLAFVNDSLDTENIPFVFGRVSSQLSPAVVRSTGVLRETQSRGGTFREDVDFANSPDRRGPVWYDRQLDSVRNQQRLFAAEYSRAALVSTDDIPLVDAWHFNYVGYATLGRRFAYEMTKLLSSTSGL